MYFGSSVALQALSVSQTCGQILGDVGQDQCLTPPWIQANPPIPLGHHNHVYEHDTPTALSEISIIGGLARVLISRVSFICGCSERFRRDIVPLLPVLHGSLTK